MKKYAPALIMLIIVSALGLTGRMQITKTAVAEPAVVETQISSAR